MTTETHCYDCKKEVGHGISGLIQTVRDRHFRCFDCLDAFAPEEVGRYPGWRTRVFEARKRAEQARKNFGSRD